MLYLAQGQVKKYPLLYLAFWPKNQGGFQEEYYFHFLSFCSMPACNYTFKSIKSMIS